MREVKVGDTVFDLDSDALPLEGYQEIKPNVYSNLYPSDSSQYKEFKKALEELQIQDSSLSLESIDSQLLGPGFRCGFLGLLHREIICERVQKEYELEIIVSPPSVTYQIVYANDEILETNNPQKIPSKDKVKSFKELYISLDITTPEEYLGAISELCQIHQDFAYDRAKVICERLKTTLNKQNFSVPIQACIGKQVIARETLPALKKHVTGNLYGGDRTRKMKLWAKQKKGKKIGMTQIIQKEGYEACQLAFGDCPEKKLNKPLKGHLKDISPKRNVREIRDMTGFEQGSLIDLALFKEGEEVKITGNSKGKGTAGVVKRYGFKIGNMSHGGGYPHRLIGSMGGGRGTNQGIPKGKKMPGRMGNEKVTQKSVIEKIDKENQIIFVRGAVPGISSLLALFGLLLVFYGRKFFYSQTTYQHKEDSENEYESFLRGELFCPHCGRKVIDVILDSSIKSKKKIKRYFHSEGDLFCPRMTGDPPPELPDDPPNPSDIPNLQEEKVKKEVLAKIFLSETEILSLLSSVPYQGDRYVINSFEEIQDRDNELIKQKVVNIFTSLPSSDQEFKKKYNQIVSEKKIFRLMSIIPRKTDGSVDWIKFQIEYFKSTTPQTVEVVEEYLRNRYNPSVEK
ncbi:4400_t:CDS:2 [Ambispora leptoticha]|uniref:4400_t:CDS:1 n=1 Tax=Ambispora leptoticha TaxID=144679 RepID=A0A9N8ZIU4_9GLOM|nr:4400_t:CDS:2 [Ambispora leptoticha]